MVVRNQSTTLRWSTFHSLTREAIDQYVPRSSGIYLLWVKLTSGKWKCFYVGQASNLEDRVGDHLDASEPNACIRVHVRDHICGFEYAEISAEHSRDGVEKYLYDVYSPECNQRDPGGNPIAVNLP